MAIENISFSDVKEGTLSDQIFHNLCEKTQLKYKIEQGGIKTLFSIKINPDDLKHPLVFIENSLGIMGNIYLKKILIQLDQNPEGARLIEGYHLVVRFESFETGPVNFDLATFSPRKILGQVVNTHLTTFTPYTINNSEGQLKIIKEKVSMKHRINEFQIMGGLVQRAARFKLST